MKITRRSHPARGAWIEIRVRQRLLNMYRRRTPQGVRGLKCDRNLYEVMKQSVAPRKGCVD